MTDLKPTITWMDFLSAAPYFTSALDMAYEDMPKAAPLVRAILYFDIFDGQVCNGGVMQYFFNMAHMLPGFDKAAEYAAQHPALKTALPFMEKAHAAFDAVKDEVATARETNEWPEDLFSKNNFDELETEFYAVNHHIRMDVYRAILENPQDYVNIRTNPSDEQLVFENGFPVGPNIIKKKNGDQRIVWFTPDRMHLEIDEAGWSLDGSDERRRYWVDYRTKMGGSRDFKNGKLERFKTEKSQWYDHGVSQWFNEDGTIDSTTLTLDREKIASQREGETTFSNFTRKQIFKK
ncbi:MAG: DMP19 family protein [Maricaulaceae bacterium]